MQRAHLDFLFIYFFNNADIFKMSHMLYFYKNKFLNILKCWKNYNLILCALNTVSSFSELNLILPVFKGKSALSYFIKIYRFKGSTQFRYKSLMAVINVKNNYYDFWISLQCSSSFKKTTHTFTKLEGEKKH